MLFHHQFHHLELSICLELIKEQGFFCTTTRLYTTGRSNGASKYEEQYLDRSGETIQISSVIYFHSCKIKQFNTKKYLLSGFSFNHKSRKKFYLLSFSIFKWKDTNKYLPAGLSMWSDFKMVAPSFVTVTLRPLPVDCKILPWTSNGWLVSIRVKDKIPQKSEWLLSFI